MLLAQQSRPFRELITVRLVRVREYTVQTPVFRNEFREILLEKTVIARFSIVGAVAEERQAANEDEVGTVFLGHADHGIQRLFGVRDIRENRDEINAC